MSLAQYDPKFESTPSSKDLQYFLNSLEERDKKNIEDELKILNSKYPTDVPMVLINGMTADDMLQNASETKHKIEILNQELDKELSKYKNDRSFTTTNGKDESINEIKNAETKLYTQKDPISLGVNNSTNNNIDLNIGFNNQDENSKLAVENFDRFKNSPCYNTLGFNPNLGYDKLEKEYNDCESEKMKRDTINIGKEFLWGLVITFMVIATIYNLFFSDKRNRY